MDSPKDIAVDMVGSKLYWAEAGDRIRRANLNGANIEDIVTGLVAPRNLEHKAWLKMACRRIAARQLIAVD